MDDKVVNLGPSVSMQPDQALAEAAKLEWSSVMIVGFTEESGFTIIADGKTNVAKANLICDMVKFEMLQKLAVGDEE